jgi:hypothetical protein
MLDHYKDIPTVTESQLAKIFLVTEDVIRFRLNYELRDGVIMRIN